MTGPAATDPRPLPGAAREAIECREELLRAALKVFSAERELDGEGSAVQALQKAGDRLALAARAYTKAVNGLAPERQPKGWKQ